MAAICGETISVDELWREILLRAPTKDVARSCCVSTQWRGIVRDPAFRKLHHDRHAVPSKDDVPDALLVVTVDIDGQSVSTVVPAMVSPVWTSQRAPMYRVIKNGISYSLANVCNGFLCFASWSRAKVVVWYSEPSPLGLMGILYSSGKRQQ
uniref:F-box domain-containing protein n=1 Tax=Oryza meridionalis TaxID=40149 RepID=A0A0E0D6I4_9ORYZ